MILLPTEGLLIITPPRCASRALHHFYCDNLHVGTKSGHHQSVPPPGTEDWDKIIVVRNPYRRMESLYRLHRQFRGTFYEWAEKTKNYWRSCRSYHDDCPNAHVVHVENLQEELASFGINGRVPRRHESVAERPIEKPNETIRIWAEPDLAYGYDPE